MVCRPLQGRNHQNHVESAAVVERLSLCRRSLVAP